MWQPPSEQIRELEGAGCELIRVAVPDLAAAAAVSKIRDQITIPLICDIHFDYRLALAAMENGAQAIRINPGNLGGSGKAQTRCRCSQTSACSHPCRCKRRLDREGSSCPLRISHG